MRSIDALRINRLLAPVLCGKLAIDDDGALEAAVALAHDAHRALSAGLTPEDITDNWSDRAIALGWIDDDDELTCQCGRVQSANYDDCESCGRPVVVPETVTARLTNGVVICGRCHGSVFALDLGDGTARPMTNNDEGNLAFSDRATIPTPAAALGREHVGVPRIVCVNLDCGTVVNVPDFARLDPSRHARRRRWLPDRRRRAMS